MSSFRISHIIKPTLVLVIYFALCNYTLAQEPEISASKVISGDTILRKIFDRDSVYGEKPVESDYDLTYTNELPNFVNNDDTEVIYTAEWKPYSKTKRRDKHRIYKKTSGITCCPCQVRGRDIYEPTIYDRLEYKRRATPISQQEETLIQPVKVGKTRRLLSPDGRPSSTNGRNSIPVGAQIVGYNELQPVRVVQTRNPQRRTFFGGDWSGSSPSVSASLTSPAVSKLIFDKVDDGRNVLSQLLGKGTGKVQVGASVGAAPSRPRPSPSKDVKVSYATPSVQARVSNRPLVNQVGVSYGTSPKGGRISYQPPSTKGKVSYQPSSAQFKIGFGRRSDDTESSRPGRRTFFLGRDWLAPRPAVSASLESPGMAQFILDKVDHGRNALADLLGRGTSNVQVSVGAARPRPKPSPKEEQNEYEVPSTEGRVSNPPAPRKERVPIQPAPRDERVPIQPAPRDERVPIQPAPRDERVPIQPAPRDERVPIQPAPRDERVPIQRAPKDERVPIQPAPRDERVPIQPAPRDERVPIQPAPRDERVPNQRAPRDERVPIQPAPRDERILIQPAPRDERVPIQPAPRDERVPNQLDTRDEIISNQPAPSEERVPEQPPLTEGRVSYQPPLTEGQVSNQPAPSEESDPNQPSTRDEIVSNQPAPSEERVPDQAPITEEKVSNQPDTRDEIVSNQPGPSEERVPDQSSLTEVGVSNQSPSTEAKVSYEPGPTEDKNEIADVAVQQSEGSPDATTY